MPLSRVQQLSFSIFAEYIQHVKHASHMVLHDLQPSLMRVSMLVELFSGGPEHVDYGWSWT